MPIPFERMTGGENLILVPCPTFDHFMAACLCIYKLTPINAQLYNLDMHTMSQLYNRYKELTVLFLQEGSRIDVTRKDSSVHIHFQAAEISVHGLIAQDRTLDKEAVPVDPFKQMQDALDKLEHSLK